MNGTAYYLIPAVSHHWQLLDMQFLTIYLIYNHAHLNFHFAHISNRSISFYKQLTFIVLFYMDLRQGTFKR